MFRICMALTAEVILFRREFCCGRSAVGNADFHTMYSVNLIFVFANLISFMSFVVIRILQKLVSCREQRKNNPNV